MYIIRSTTEQGAIPAPLAARYKTADGPALKVALYLLCEQSAAEAADIAAALNMPEETVSRALAFWCAAGLVETSDGAAPAAPAKPAPAPLPAARPTLSVSDMRRMTLRDEGVSLLLQEAQNILGRPLDSLESRVLLESYEYDKLPVEAMLLLLVYWLPRLKNKRKVIHTAVKTAMQLTAEGIDSLPLVEERIRLWEARETREAAVAAALGRDADSFTKTAKKQIAQWHEEFGYDVDFVKEAMLRTGNTDVPYLHAVLKSWHKNGYKTIRDTRAEAAPNAPAQPSAKRTAGKQGSLLKRAVTDIAEKEKDHGIQ